MLLLFLSATTVGAQQSSYPALISTAGFAADKYVESQAPIELRLSRLPAASEGRLAVFVGTTDLTALFESVGSTLVFRSNGVDLPSGESELKLFLVVGTSWKELSKLPIRVLTPRGFETARFDPKLELRNAGQLAEGHSGSATASIRPRYQTIAGTASLQTAHTRDGFSLTSDTHVLGANEGKDALRFAEKGDEASRIDLSDYAVRYERPGTVLSLGQVSTGVNRHLINAFASRGVTAVIAGPRASLWAGAENATSIVGLDNIAGVDHDDHRVLSSGFSLELLPERPGGLHLDGTALAGSTLGATGFTQGGIVSADRSDGYGVQVAASTPSQRIRFATGLTSSRSEFATDPPFLNGRLLVDAQPHRKNARYAELNLGVLQDYRLFDAVPATLGLALRHERVDPLYRSVAALMQSDIERNGFDVSGTMDVVTVQVSGGRTEDNLDGISSLLTSRTRSLSVAVGTALASLLRITSGASWFPAVSYTMQRMHQFGAGIPTGGLLTASDIPNQLSVVQDASAQWKVQSWQFAYRLNQSDQDNRQPGLELADFATQTHGLTVGVSPDSTLTLGLDLGLERLNNKQLAQVNHVRRAGVTANWRVMRLTTLDGSLTMSKTVDPGAGSDARVSALQLGIARSITLWRSADDTPQGQLSVRFSKFANDLYNLGASSAPPTMTSGTWNVASGLSLRLF